MNTVVSCENVLTGRNTAHDPLSIDIESETITCLIGPIGSYKSAYMRTLAGIDPPYQGNVRVIEKNLTQLPKAEQNKLRRYIGYILPNSPLVSTLSIMQNIMLPAEYHRIDNPAAIKEHAETLLGWINVDIDPQRLAGTLSLFERHLIAIARVLLLRPSLLFIDDAFTQSDAEQIGLLEKIYRKICHEQKVALVVASHAPGFASRYADLIVFMHPHGGRTFRQWSELQKSEDAHIQSFIQANVACGLQ